MLVCHSEVGQDLAEGGTCVREKPEGDQRTARDELERPQIEQLEASFLRTLTESDLRQLAIDAIDTVSGVPVLGLFQKSLKVMASVPNYFFVKKMIRFLFELKDIPPEQRREQLARLSVVPGEQERVGETILLLLDRMNNMQKPGMMGKAFKALLHGRINLEQLQRLNFAIDMLDISRIPILERMYSQRVVAWGGTFEVKDPYSLRDLGYDTLQHFAICGLLDIHFEEIETVGVLGDGGPPPKAPAGGFRTNTLGKLFVEVVL